MSHGGDAGKAAKDAVSESGVAPRVALDNDLAAITAAWPMLPEAIRAAILAMIAAATR